LTVLRALPIFETLDDVCLKPITHVAMLRHIPRDTVVLHAGDCTDNIYLYCFAFCACSSYYFLNKSRNRFSDNLFAPLGTLLRLLLFFNLWFF